MSKITFRADEELVEELETFDASKSEVMRRALREFLEQHVDATPEGVPEAEDFASASAPLDDVIARRVDAYLRENLPPASTEAGGPQDVNVNIRVADEPGDGVAVEAERKTGAGETDPGTGDERKTCHQCGEAVEDDHVYCPNCGQKADQRVFCECGDELRVDWAFCPGCGRRTPAADVLDSA